MKCLGPPPVPTGSAPARIKWVGAGSLGVNVPPGPPWPLEFSKCHESNAGNPGGVVADLADANARFYGWSPTRPDPSTTWYGKYLVLEDGTYATWDGTQWVRPTYTLTLSYDAQGPGPCDLDDANRAYSDGASPIGDLWPQGKVAYFEDGFKQPDPWNYFVRWDGAKWVIPEVVFPGDTTTLASTDLNAVPPDPLSAWATGESSTFTDGDFYWDATAWVAGTAP